MIPFRFHALAEMVHAAASRSISFHVARRSSPDRATVSPKSSNASLVPYQRLRGSHGDDDVRLRAVRQRHHVLDDGPLPPEVVIALIVTPDGFPLAYEVMPGNTTDQTTLAGFLAQIEQQYGRSDRVWIMDRGIPTEATLAAMREPAAPSTRRPRPGRASTGTDHKGGSD